MTTAGVRLQFQAYTTFFKLMNIREVKKLKVGWKPEW